MGRIQMLTNQCKHKDTGIALLDKELAMHKERASKALEVYEAQRRKL